MVLLWRDRIPEDFLMQQSTSLENQQDQLPSNIFRAYDIRGNAESELTPKVVHDIGMAFGSEISENGGSTCAVGCDGRLSSPTLVEALIKGILATGCHVKDIGLVATPVLYYAVKRLGTDAGVMLTGSHNPKDDNGLKMVQGCAALSGEAIQQLKKRILDQNFVQGKGSVEKIAIIDNYMRALVETFSHPLKLKVVIDTANGATSHIAPTLFRRLGADVIELFAVLDGNFPNHHPDPSKPKNLQTLIAKVKEEGADLGFGFDGDGDRLGIVTKTGKIIWPDRQMMFFAKGLLHDHSGAKVLFDVKSSRDLTDVINQAGGEPIMFKTGHSLIKAEMRRIDAILAGEMSGHIVFNDKKWIGVDDAMYNGARLLEMMQEDGRDLDAIFNDIPERISTPELAIAIAEDEKFSFMDKVLSQASIYFDEKIITLDGLRVEFDEGWGLVRASNTTPMLTVRFEADSDAALFSIQQRFSDFLLGLNNTLTLPF